MSRKSFAGSALAPCAALCPPVAARTLAKRMDPPLLEAFAPQIKVALMRYQRAARVANIQPE